MYILGFNGPPRSGKDTLANAIIAQLEQGSSIPILKLPFSMPMRKRAMAAIGLPYDEATYERIKDQPIAALGGVTLRRFMILDSEEFMKRQFGQDVWCRLWRENIPLGFQGLVVTPDFGFPQEVEAAQAVTGHARFRLVQVSRLGTDWRGDSRGPLYPLGSCIPVENGNDINGVPGLASRVIHELRTFNGWKF